MPPTRELLTAVAFEAHLYSVPDERGVPSPALEQRLARDIERPFSAWHRRVVKAPRGTAPRLLERMTRHERAMVARYVLYQHLRTPAQRRMSERQSVLSHHLHAIDPETRATFRRIWHNLGETGRAPFRVFGGELDFEAFVAFQTVRIRVNFDADRTRWLHPIDRFVEQLVAPVVDERAWRIVELPPDVERTTPLITCDSPVVLARPRPSSEALEGQREPGWDVRLGGGWNDPTLQVTLALSPRHALMIARDPTALTFADDPARFAAACRVRAARHALQHVYARSQDEQLTALVRATRGPDVVFEVAGVRLPATVDPREIMRRVAEADLAAIGIEFTDE